MLTERLNSVLNFTSKRLVRVFVWLEWVRVAASHQLQGAQGRHVVVVVMEVGGRAGRKGGRERMEHI